MKKIMRFIKGYEVQSILAPLFKLFEALMDLLIPIVVARIIDNGIAVGNSTYVWRYFWLLILLAALGLAFSLTAQWFAANASVGFATALRGDLFRHIQSFSYSALDKAGTDTLITRMTSDVNLVQSGVNMALRLLLRSPFIVVGAMIMSFTIDVKCALVFAVAIPLLSLVVGGIMYVTIPLFKKAQAALDEVLGITRENLTGVRVVRAFCMEEDEIREFDDKNAALTRLNEFVGRISALMNPMTFLMVNVATIFLIRQGAIQVNMGVLRQGDVVAMYNYMAQMIVELVKFASLVVTINKGLAGANRIADVFEIQSGMEYAAGNTKKTVSKKSTAVKFENVSFAYSLSGEEAVSDLNFSVRKGQTIGIIGATGSGKSTLVNLIPRFYDVTSGRVLIDDIDVREYEKNDLLSRFGIVPQKAVLFAGTIRENMRWGNESATDQEIWKAIETAQATEVVKGKDNGLDYYVEQNGRNLSGGQRQRLTIARALVRNPEILILDDSASALDFATDARLRAAVGKLDMTVFIVSQRTSSIKNADHILVMDDGRIVGQGTHDELMKTCTIYQEIYYSQFPEEKKNNEFSEQKKNSQREKNYDDTDSHNMISKTDSGKKNKKKNRKNNAPAQDKGVLA